MGKRSNGEGTIVQRPDGRWAGAVTLADGSRKWRYGRSQAEVAQKVFALRQDRDRGVVVASDRRTVGQYLESWIVMREPNLRPGAHANYAWYARHYLIPHIGRVGLSKLTAEHVQRLMSTLTASRLAPSTVRYALAVLRNALNEAVGLSILPRNVATLVKPPRARRVEMKCWDPEQMQRFLGTTTGDRLHALYAVALTTGMREGELLALRWRDVSLPVGKPGSISVQHTLHWRGGVMSLEEVKTDASRRHIQLSVYASEALREHHRRQREEWLKLGPAWREHDLIFCNTIGGGIKASNLRRQSFLPLVRLAGVPRIRPYDMRHTAATVLLISGVQVKVVSGMLGHSSVTITLMVYSHVLAMIQGDSAAAMDRLLSAPIGVVEEARRLDQPF